MVVSIGRGDHRAAQVLRRIAGGRVMTEGKGTLSALLTLLRAF